MFKKSNSGFTLLELLISICILTTVIFIGYKVIDKATIDIKNQGNINKGQLTMNDMNEYLTKDLEQAKSVALFLNNENIADTLVEENNNVEEKQNILSDKISNLKNELNELSIDNKFDYSYAIRFKNDENNTYSIKYKVEIAKSNQYYKYSISREENNGIKISFINEAVLKEKELPFLIEGNSPYKVTLGYTGKGNSFIKHEFTITYRLNDIISTNNPPSTEIVPPQVDDILPPADWGNYNVLGFWTADADKKTENNLYTWISTYGEILGEAYANRESGKNDKFNIEGYARPGNNEDTGSYIGYKTMDNDKSWKGQVKNVFIGDKNISKISIYISPHTKLQDFNIKKTQGEGSITLEGKELEGGEGGKWYHCSINAKSKINFEFTGKLSIDKNKVNSGYAYVVYERVDSSNQDALNGDLIFELTKKESSQGNRGQYDWNTAVKYNMLGNILSKENTQYSLSEFKRGHFNIFLDNSSDQGLIRSHIMGNSVEFSDERLKNVIGMKIKLEGNIEITEFRIDNFNNVQNINLTNTDTIYEFKEFSKAQRNIQGYINILPNEEVGYTSRIIIDFIYEE